VPFEIRKILNEGVSHPVVARLGVQVGEVLDWAGLEKAKRDAVSGLYIHTLTWRLLQCHKCRDEIIQLMNESVSNLKNQSNANIREVPHVIGLEALVGQFLYEAKNYIRDLLQLFEIIYGCGLKDASAFADMKNRGDGDFVSWTIEKFGNGNSLTEMARADQGWIGEIIRSRNALEHPGGLSGTLAIENIRVNPTKSDTYISPTWHRTGKSESDILKDMDCNLDNLLTFGEDLLVEVVRRAESSKMVSFYQIPVEERNPVCPVRIRVDLSPEVLAKVPRKA
jgi:hypothetical protein